MLRLNDMKTANNKLRFSLNYERFVYRFYYPTFFLSFHKTPDKRRGFCEKIITLYLYTE